VIEGIVFGTDVIVVVEGGTGEIVSSGALVSPQPAKTRRTETARPKPRRTPARAVIWRYPFL
jgi:hypothetical protein